MPLFVVPQPAAGITIQSRTPTSITFAAGELAAGETKQVTFLILLPKGVEDRSLITIAATLAGEEPQGCGRMSAADAHPITVAGTPSMQINITNDLSFIPQRQTVEYAVNFYNKGNVAIPRTAMVAIVPDDMQLDYVRTTGQ